MNLDHVAIAVKNAEEAAKDFEKLGLEFKGIEVIEEQGVRIAVLMAGDVRIELLEPLSEDSPVGKFISNKGEGLHHIAFRVEDISSMLKEVEREGLRLIDREPRVGLEGSLIGFIHPKSLHGVLVELCQRD